MRRAAISITSNISEGFGRRHQKEKLQFYQITLGSISELHNQLLIARDLSYISPDIFQKIEVELTLVAKLVFGLTMSIRKEISI